VTFPRGILMKMARKGEFSLQISTRSLGISTSLSGMEIEKVQLPAFFKFNFTSREIYLN
jgi:hypothetical protein